MKLYYNFSVFSFFQIIIFYGFLFFFLQVKHGKSYENKIDETYRFNIFINNLKTIADHNRDYEDGTVSFKLGQNQFTDMFTHELIGERNGFNGTLLNENIGNNVIEYLSPQNVVVPPQIDWRTLGAVTDVKDQGNTYQALLKSFY